MRSQSARYRWAPLLAACMVLSPVHAVAAELLIFAASSLKPALDELLASGEVKQIGNVRASYAASSQLARQIDNAAPADVFISADEDWMDYLAMRNRIVTDTRSDLLGNALVLVAPSASPLAFKIQPGVDLAAFLGPIGHLSMAEPNSVPAGKYARSALQSIGAWHNVRDRIVAADNVRAALNFVVRGEVELGIVYRSDVIGEPAVRVVDTFPANTHAPIRYPVAMIAGRDSAAARRLIALMHSDSSAALFRRHGFDAPPR